MVLAGDISSTGVKVISGTNVNFRASATSVVKLAEDPATIGPPPAPYIGYSVHKLQIWIGSEYLGEFGPAVNTELARFVRFATTHFDHNSTQRIIMRSEIRVWTSTPAEYDEIIGICYQDVKIWNKAFPLATRIGLNQNSDPEVWEDNLSLLVPTLAQGAISNAISGITQMKHVSDPNSVSGAQQLHIADCIDKFKTSTVFLASTHGFGTGICDCYGFPDWNTGMMNWTGTPSVTQYVQQNRGDIPLYNLVVLMVCEGVVNGNWAATYLPFGISRAQDPGGLSIDKCVVTWSANIPAHTNVNSDGSNRWQGWYESVLKYLRNGYTIKDSILNSKVDGYFIRDSQSNYLLALTLGDEKTKLIGYYESAEGDTTWFRVTQ